MHFTTERWRFRNFGLRPNMTLIKFCTIKVVSTFPLNSVVLKLQAGTFLWINFRTAEGRVKNWNMRVHMRKYKFLGLHYPPKRRTMHPILAFYDGQRWTGSNAFLWVYRRYPHRKSRPYSSPNCTFENLPCTF